MQYVGQRARCVPPARVAVFGCIVECRPHRCDQGFAHLAEAFDLLLRRHERELAPLASVPLDFTRPPAEAGGDVVDDPHRVAATRQVAQAVDGYPFGVGSNALDPLGNLERVGHDPLLELTERENVQSRLRRRLLRWLRRRRIDDPIEPFDVRGAACSPPVAEPWCAHSSPLPSRLSLYYGRCELSLEATRDVQTAHFWTEWMEQLWNRGGAT